MPHVQETFIKVCSPELPENFFLLSGTERPGLSLKKIQFRRKYDSICGSTVGFIQVLMFGEMIDRRDFRRRFRTTLRMRMRSVMHNDSGRT